MKKVLLVGCGAEIGSSLLLLSDPKKNGFEITDVLTSPIIGDKRFPNLTSIHSIVTRISLCGLNRDDELEVINDCSIRLNGRVINFIFEDLHTFLERSPQTQWDLAIIATSKDHLRDINLLRRFQEHATFVTGVAESPIMAKLYPPLIGNKSEFFRPQIGNKNQKLFCFGSCQTVGWLAQLVPVLNALSADSEKLLGIEVDIVHPDTPSGQLGTRSFSAREQDARGNLRPSFSQIDEPMKNLFPEIISFHTISLRVPIEAPGYQIMRLFFSSNRNISRSLIFDGVSSYAQANPTTIKLLKIPMGSKAFNNATTVAYMLSDMFFRFEDNRFGNKIGVSQLITQSYISNVKGYCASVLRASAYLLSQRDPEFFAV